MAIDTPAKIAVLGAGPIGLEAALYARFLGYDVVIIEQGEVAASVRRWGHVRMFTPFGMNRSPLGLAAIEAQDEAYRPPADDELLTGHEWTERYLLPLSQTDLLADHLRTNTTVVAIGKEELLKGDLPGHEDRGDWSFRILVRDAAGQEHIETADAVLDCTGVFGQSNNLGEGGLPAIGELSLRERIEYRLPDILGRDRERFAGKHTLLSGAGCSAATNAIALAALAREAPGTRLTWITRREGPAGAGGPITVLQGDRLPSRVALAQTANALTQGSPAMSYLPATVVHRITAVEPAGWEVELAGRHAGPLHVDEIIANVGFRPDTSLFAELQVRECSATQGLLSQDASGPMALEQPEPNFYVLGAKSRGRRSDFLVSDGLAQIRDVFTIIGDRSTLDLYAHVKLPR
jgi:thioredoxin reductase